MFNRIMNLGSVALLASFLAVPAFAGEVDEEKGAAPENLIVHRDEKTNKLTVYSVPADVKFEMDAAKKLKKEDLDAKAKEIIAKVAKKENEIDPSKLVAAVDPKKSELSEESGTTACWWPFRRFVAYCAPVVYYPMYIGYCGISYGWGWGWNNWGFYGGGWGC